MQEEPEEGNIPHNPKLEQFIMCGSPSTKMDGIPADSKEGWKSIGEWPVIHFNNNISPQICPCCKGGGIDNDGFLCKVCLDYDFVHDYKQNSPDSVLLPNGNPPREKTSWLMPFRKLAAFLRVQRERLNNFLDSR